MRREDIDALLFDFGGVLVEIDFDHVLARWAELAGVGFSQVKERFDYGEAYRRHERGEIDAAAYFEALRAALGIRLSDDAFADGWARVSGPEIAPTVALLPRLAARIPVHVLSNTNLTHHRCWAARYEEALRPVSRRFVSSEMGLRKPERESFEHVARVLRVPIGRILFFDGTAANIEGALAAGMPAVRVKCPADVERAVRPWLE